MNCSQLAIALRSAYSILRFGSVANSRSARRGYSSASWSILPNSYSCYSMIWSDTEMARCASLTQ
eukprot:scaffold267356_cov35-Tisochrysis_lutea.AAC.4